MAEWLEKEVYSVEESSAVEELQSCRCPHCKRVLTTPYMYYFTDYPYCPSCGEPIKGKRATALSATMDIIKGSGLSRSEVARQSGISVDTIRNYYNMRFYPNIANFVDVCRACGVRAIIENGEIIICQKKST